MSMPLSSFTPWPASAMDQGWPIPTLSIGVEVVRMLCGRFGAVVTESDVRGADDASFVLRIPVGVPLEKASSK